MIKNFDRYFEKTDGLETEYMKILYYDLDKDFKGTYKTYQYTRLCTITSGLKHVRINDGQEFTYSDSDFILLPPHASVDMVIPEKTIAVVYELNDKLIEDTLKKVEVKHELNVDMTTDFVKKNLLLPQVKTHIERIKQYALSDDPNKQFLIDLCSQELTYNLINHYRLSLDQRKKQEPVEYAIHCLKNNLSDPDLTVKEIAYALNMSPSNLVLLFRRATGMTPKAYHNRLKLNKAKELLKHKNVSEVCYDLGFESISYFIKLFKGHFGITPKQYSLKVLQGTSYEA